MLINIYNKRFRQIIKCHRKLTQQFKFSYYVKWVGVFLNRDKTTQVGEWQLPVIYGSSLINYVMHLSYDMILLKYLVATFSVVSVLQILALKLWT